MRRLTDRQRGLGEYLIGNIDDDGYIRRELIHIVDDLAFNQNVMTSEEELEEVLDVVQGLEPAGVGARDLRECLALQLNRRSQQAFTSIAQAILEDHFDAFTKKHYSKIMERLEIEEETLRSALDEIIKLNPKPGSSFSGGSKAITQAITPDFYIQLKDGNVEYLLNARNAPELNISREYKNMLEHYKEQKTPSKSDKEAVLFVKQKIDSAKWFVEAVRQRQRTLLLVIDALVERQNAYFLTGDESDLQPMILKDIAEMTDLDISTVSRVASNKYAQTPYGTFLLKELFSESMTNDQGEEVSTREIKKYLKELIEGESKSKPLTDEKLAAALKEKGYPIARRTIAKYREQLGMPTARLRKEL
jgi:RNA polymerase sigma-54 factor